MADEVKRPNRRAGIVATLLVLCGFGALAYLLVAVFQIGMATGLAVCVGTLAAYQVPATICDWPRLTLDNIVEFLRFLFYGLIVAIVGFFVSIFD